MERWAYVRFVYETEEAMLLGPLPNYPSYQTPDVPEIADPNVSAPTGGGKAIPINPVDLPAGDKQDEELWGGSWLVDPCFVLNEYDGVRIFESGGTKQLLGGEMPLQRGAFEKIVAANGWAFHGSGSWPNLFQVSKLWLETNQGAKVCETWGFTTTQCRQPGSNFPLNAAPCTGDQLGGRTSDPPAESIDDLWARFKACMEQHFDC